MHTVRVSLRQQFNKPCTPNHTMYCLSVSGCIACMVLTALLSCQTRTLSPCHTMALSPCHTMTLSPCHTMTLSPCHTMTLSPCHHCIDSVQRTGILKTVLGEFAGGCGEMGSDWRLHDVHSALLWAPWCVSVPNTQNGQWWHTWLHHVCTQVQKTHCSQWCVGFKII